ncbi:TRAM domain-containing protein [Microbacterium sp. cx-55]|uniref:class I SAM-dependent RNA methyltransferase n=1 Tax=Microbacterium sp. cx-55 TaxID=2875948 RepID=UPI001CBBDB80|nr:TRAM domain-containing protein [Microbacterium sp. cx-55]MBZ4487068.1 TRAM domain-containing protein [Microbacterium sp. cx-55]UGB35984.1 TRAM domain-containing protein [Microbacterium sp. cx-55]
MDTGDVIDLEITDVAHGGVFVGRHGEPGEKGRVVFVPDTMPGERVRVRLTDTRKPAFWRGEVVEVLDASPHRRPHVWAQAGLDHPADDRPGGADFGHIALDEQRALKLRVVEDALARIGKLDLPATIEPPRPVTDAAGAVHEESEDGTGWRTRVSLHVDADGRIGPFGARSHRVVPVSEHPLATAAIAETAARLDHGRPGRIDLVQPADGRVRVLPRPDARPARRATPEVVREIVGEREFRVDAGGFWQVHRLAPRTLTDLVTDALREVGADADGWHLDLYGGVGLLAAAIGDVVGPLARITTVESDARATEHAGENLAEWVGARAETARVERWVDALASGASAAEQERLQRGVVVLDPPRSGAGTQTTRAIARLAPRAIVYVACDPVALARDLAVFREEGYEAATVRAVDLFPHSHHIEAVVALTR